MRINKHDTDGTKALLQVGEFGYDNFSAGGDVGRVYVGNGSANIAMAKKAEVTTVDGKVDTHTARADNPHSVTKTQVGLGNVQNVDTTNASNITSGTLANVRLANSGVTAGTYNSVTVDGKGIVTGGTNPTTLSGYSITDAYTKTETNTQISTAINGLVEAAPATLDTLNELAAALGDDPNFATTTANNIAAKVTKVTSTDNAVVRFDGTTGAVQNSGVIVDDSGNVGIGVTPSSSLSIYKTLEVNGAVLAGHNSKTNAELSSNTYLDSSGVSRYLANSNATSLSMYQGQYKFNVAPSGTAGNTIPWTTAMTLDASGNLAVSGTISPNKMHVAAPNNGVAEYILISGISGLSYGLVVSKDTGSNMTLSYNNQTNGLCFKIDPSGNMQTPFVYNNITASAANICMDSAGTFFRSTSSGRYKTDIETIDKTYVDTFFANARPIYYKSLSDNDNPNWGYWGFIAEEIAEFDKRLVHWRFDTKDVEVEKERIIPAVEEQKDNEGNTIQESKNESIEKYIEIEKVNDESKPMIAEGVMYERITVLLTAKVQEQQELINSLTARLDRLEGNL